MTRYVPIKEGDMDSHMRCMGFTRADTPHKEVVYTRPVTTKSGFEYPYNIMVYSTVLKSTGWTDECGADAIRVVLMDDATGMPAKESETRVHRTKNALENLKKRCRDAFRYVLEVPPCPKCGGITRKRTNRRSGNEFMGCARYAPGRPHHCTGTVAIKTPANVDTKEGSTA